MCKPNTETTQGSNPADANGLGCGTCKLALAGKPCPGAARRARQLAALQPDGGASAVGASDDGASGSGQPSQTVALPLTVIAGGAAASSDLGESES